MAIAYRATVPGMVAPSLLPFGTGIVVNAGVPVAMRKLVLQLAVSMVLWAHNPVQTVYAQDVPNTCAGWATTLHKQGTVRDSLTMHLLGCDDGPWRTTRYHAIPSGTPANVCNARARHYARLGNIAHPWHIAARVAVDLPQCHVYEDGSYGVTP